MGTYADLMKLRSKRFEKRVERKKPKLDQKLKNKITNFLISDQMGQEPTPVQVAVKATNLINEIIESDQKNIIALGMSLEKVIKHYRGE